MAKLLYFRGRREDPSPKSRIVLYLPLLRTKAVKTQPFTKKLLLRLDYWPELFDRRAARLFNRCQETSFSGCYSGEGVGADCRGQPHGTHSHTHIDSGEHFVDY